MNGACNRNHSGNAHAEANGDSSHLIKQESVTFHAQPGVAAEPQPLRSANTASVLPQLPSRQDSGSENLSDELYIRNHQRLEEEEKIRYLGWTGAEL